MPVSLPLVSRNARTRSIIALAVIPPPSKDRIGSSNCVAERQRQGYPRVIQKIDGSFDWAK